MTSRLAVTPPPPRHPEPHPPTGDVEEAVVPEGGAGVEAGVAQLHALDLQVSVVDARVLAVHHQRLVFGPVDGLGGVAGGAAQVQALPRVEREGFDRSLRSHCGDREAASELQRPPPRQLRHGGTTLKVLHRLS